MTAACRNWPPLSAWPNTATPWPPPPRASPPPKIRMNSPRCRQASPPPRAISPRNWRRWKSCAGTTPAFSASGRTPIRSSPTSAPWSRTRPSCSSWRRTMTGCGWWCCPNCAAASTMCWWRPSTTSYSTPLPATAAAASRPTRRSSTFRRKKWTATAICRPCKATPTSPRSCWPALSPCRTPPPWSR